MKVSLIIPVYNVENFLYRCLKSVENQTYKDTEVIIINDGSTDNSYKIIDEFVARNENFICYTIENSGPGGARNYGILKATGDYIVFLDSDDYISEDCIEKLFNAAQKNDSDIVVCNNYDVTEEGEIITLYECNAKNRTTSAQESPEIFFNRQCPWGKIYRKSLFDNLFYATKEWYEDLRLVLKIYLRAEKITYIEDALFFYVQRAGSIMNNAKAINLHGTANPCDDTYDRAPEHIMGILDKYKLNPAQTHLFFYNTLTSAHKTDDALEHRIMREVEVSGKIGAPWCVWHTRYYKSGDDFATGEYSEEKTFYYSQKNVTKYVEQAQKFGTGIALENLFRDRFYGGYSTLAQLCDSFKADNVGICWDTGHAHLVDYDQGEAIRFMGERIKCTHIHNNFKDRDSHLPPDEGTIDWDNVMKGFKDIGYNGPLTLETHCLYPQDEQFMRDFARYNLNCLEFLQRVKERV